MSDLISCPQCQRVVLPGDRFCAGCGSPLQPAEHAEIHPAPAAISWRRPTPWMQHLLSRPHLLTALALAGLGLVIGALLARSGQSPLVFTPASEPSKQSETTSNLLSAAPDLKTLSAAVNSTSPKRPASSAAPTRWEIAEGLVNLRESPSLSGKVLLRVKQGAEFEGTGQKFQGEGHEWVELLTDDGQRGWVSARLLKPLPAPKPYSAKISASPPPSQSVKGRLLNHEKLSGWTMGQPADRQRTALAMTRLMFPQDSAELLGKKAILLEACITGSAEDTAIKHHEVAEIAAICALLLGWQEKASPQAGASP